MKYLLYCISRGADYKNNLLGVDEKTVFFVNDNGLNAAVSECGNENSAENISQIMAYKNVIEVLHHHFGAIPICYGSIFDETSHIATYLREHGKRYEQLIDELGSCVEIGIRVYAEQSKDCDPPILSSGRAFLHARRNHYAPNMPPVKEIEELYQQCCRTFEGLFVKSKIETPLSQMSCRSYGIPLPAFYFLVPKGFVNSFRKTFQNILPSIKNDRFELVRKLPISATRPSKRAEKPGALEPIQRVVFTKGADDADTQKSVKLLLTGPWPPYNFCFE